MKKIFLLILVSSLTSISCVCNTLTVFITAAPAPLVLDSHFNVVIGTAGTVNTVTYSKTKMKLKWETYIGIMAPNLDSNSFTIILDAFTGLYYLTGISVGGNSKSSILLELDNGNFYIAPKGSCTCTSNCCTAGCVAKYDSAEGAWNCSSCNSPLGCSNCGKTETSGYSPIFD